MWPNLHEFWSIADASYKQKCFLKKSVGDLKDTTLFLILHVTAAKMIMLKKQITTLKSLFWTFRKNFLKPERVFVFVYG